MHRAVERYRTKPKRQYPPPEVPDNVEFDLDLLPTRATYRYLAERAARDGVQVTTGPQATNRAVDQPLRGLVAVMPRDEREAKYGRPLIYADFQAGKPPILIANAAAYHLEKCQEWIAEMRHYGQDQPEPDEDVPDPAEAWLRWCAIKRAHTAGRHTYGAATRGVLGKNG